MAVFDAQAFGRCLEVTGIGMVGLGLGLKRVRVPPKLDYRWVMIVGAVIMSVGMMIANDTPISMM